MTNSIAELEECKCFFAIGTNTTAAHPVIAYAIKRAVKKGAKLIVANPREIGLCKHATMHIQHRPGSDVALMMGMAKVIVDEGLENRDFISKRTQDFDDFKNSLSAFDLDTVEKITGVAKEQVVEAARMYATNNPASILYAMGITQHTHGTDNVWCTSNLALLTGNIGKASTGVNPLRGQNNVQGACDLGALPNVFTGYQKVEDEKARKKFSDYYGVKLNDKVGITHTEMFDAAYDKKLKAMYLVGENPVLSEANCSHAEEAIRRLEFLVVQDIFLTETAKYADVVLPARSYAEKDGTFTNTERRVQKVRQALRPIGESKDDWWIVAEIAKRMGAEGFDYRNSESIFREISELTPSYGGISYQRLEELGSLQWPCPTAEHPGTKFLHSEKFLTPSSLGVFKQLSYRPPAELPDEDYPYLLTTDRSLYHYHTATMTRKVDGLNMLRKGEQVEINPEDADLLGINNGDKVTVTSRRGEVEAEAFVTRASPKGVVCMTFHFSETPTNVLTNCALDPIAKIPETKVCAVQITPFA